MTLFHASRALTVRNAAIPEVAGAPALVPLKLAGREGVNLQVQRCRFPGVQGLELLRRRSQSDRSALRLTAPEDAHPRSGPQERSTHGARAARAPARRADGARQAAPGDLPVSERVGPKHHRRALQLAADRRLQIDGRRRNGSKEVGALRESRSGDQLLEPAGGVPQGGLAVSSEGICGSDEDLRVAEH